MKSPDPQAQVLVFGIQATWVALAATAIEVAALYWYIAAARRCTVRGRPWPAYKTALFVLGVAVVAYTMGGGIARFEQDNFTLNVVRTLLLVYVAPSLLCLGSPLSLALRASSRQRSDELLRALHSPLAMFVSRPVVSFGFAMATLYVYFLTPLYRVSEQHAALFGYMQLQLLVAGCLLWWPIVGKDVSPRPLNFVPRFVLVTLTVPFTVALGVTVSSFSHALFPAANTVADSQAGGDVLWELAQVFVVFAVALLFVSWAGEEERKAVTADRQLDAALEASREGEEALLTGLGQAQAGPSEAMVAWPSEGS